MNDNVQTFSPCCPVHLSNARKRNIIYYGLRDSYIITFRTELRGSTFIVILFYHNFDMMRDRKVDAEKEEKESIIPNLLASLIFVAKRAHLA